MPDSQGRERRRYPRATTRSLRGDLGIVLDLSPSGMRVLASQVPDGRLPVTLLAAEGPVSVQAEVAWSRRRGLREWELGLAFVAVGPATAARLDAIARAHRAALDPAR
jgi:hypothetical protein